MSKKLYRYQEEVVNRASESTALFWDMGLGKTITSIEIFLKFYKLGKINKLFVMCPISMVDEWCREFKNQSGLDSVKYKDAISELGKLNRKFGTNLDLKWYLEHNKISCVVLNYDMVWRINNYGWLDENWMLICDESHRIKNTSSKIGKYMKFLKYKTKYKICLTGTPQSQGYIDYYNQLFFLDKINMTLPEFKGKYCVYEDKVFNGVKIKQLTGYKNVGELEDKYIKKCEFLKIDRVYDDVIKYHKIEIPTTKEYQEVLRSRVIYFDRDGNVVSDRQEINKYLKTIELNKGLLGNNNGLLGTGDGESTIIESAKYLDNPGAYRYGLRMLLNSDYKLQWVSDFLDGYDKRVVIFYNYNCELDKLKLLLDKKKIPYSVYNGEEKSFDNFKKYENGVCLCNYQSGSVGINDLVLSNIFIAYSPSDNYINWEQSKKRIDRNGQKNTPIYYFLESGLESRIYHSLSIGKNFDDRVFISEMENNLI